MKHGSLKKTKTFVALELPEMDSDTKSAALQQLSHEFRTPLASIIGFAETILNDTDVPKDDLRQFTKIIRQEALRLSETLETVLELFRNAKRDSMDGQLQTNREHHTDG